MKKFLKVTALSATACALLGTVPVSAENKETSGTTTVTYEPGVTSPTGATWAVSYTSSIVLNNSNVIDGGISSVPTSIASKGQDITFTVFDYGVGTTSHQTNEKVKVALAQDTTDDQGKITMDTTGTVSGTPEMVLAKESSGNYEVIKAGSSSDGEIATLENTSSGTDYTTTIKAGIIDTGSMGNDAKASVDLTFKFEKQSN